MYDRQKGELKYSAELGYYYESDLKRKEKNIKIAKISAFVLSLAAIGGGILWWNASKQTPPNQSTVIEPTPKATPKPTQKPVATPTPTQVVPKPTPTVVPTLTPTPKPTTKPTPIPTLQPKKLEPIIKAKPTKEGNSSDAVFDRGAKKVFFTSMGKTVEGATIKKNVEEINLEFDDSKAKEEIKKEQADFPKKSETKTPQKKKPKENKKTKEKKKSKKPKTVTVKRGDTIYKIAKKVYGNSKSYKKILKANKLRSNRSLKIGQTLVIPE